VKKFHQWGVAGHVWLYRRTKGRRGSMGGRVLLLTTVGRRSGKVRTSPLMFVTVDDHPVVTATAGGSPHHPGWYHNLSAQPEVTVQIGPEVTERRARITSGAERTALFAQFVAQDERFAKYETRTERVIPVVVLESA
jgi:deazaflavin-dependent oxidoreductase (nitroreductase family)